jgi:uncharacterized protein YhfF
LNAVAQDYRDLPRFAFGDGPALADELLDLVIAGRKTATCMTPDDPNRPRVGQRWVVLDGRGEPACVIETTELSERRFEDVDAAFARDEGEGDGTLETWRRNHRIYFGRLGKFEDGMTLLCERFRLVEVLRRPGAPQ